LEKHNELIVQIGKNGINEASITEIKTHLKRRKDVKVKFLQSFIADKDRKKVKEEILSLLNKRGRLVGNSLTVYWRNG